MSPSILLAVLVMIIVALFVVVIWPFGRPPRHRATPPMGSRRATPVGSRRATPPAGLTPTGIATQPLPAPVSVAPSDPDEASSLLQLARSMASMAEAAIATLPAGMLDRTMMEQELAHVRERLVFDQDAFGNLDAAARARHVPDLKNHLGRLVGLYARAQEQMEWARRLAAAEERLVASVASLQVDLDGLEHAWPYPVMLPSVREALERSRLPAAAPPATSNALRVRLEEVERALAEVERGRATVLAAQAQRGRLQALLATPELDERLLWQQSLVAASRRLGGPPGPLGPLLASGERLAARRRALFTGCPPAPGGGVCLDGARLPALIAEAQAIGAEVRALWDRARVLTTAGQPGMAGAPGH